MPSFVSVVISIEEIPGGRVDVGYGGTAYLLEFDGGGTGYLVRSASGFCTVDFDPSAYDDDFDFGELIK